jgi:hypothetical protein
MKRIIYLTFCIACMVGQSALANNKNTNIKESADTARKKVVHPKEAMTDAEVNNILNAMRQKNTDLEKVQVLKDRVRDKA